MFLSSDGRLVESANTFRHDPPANDNAVQVSGLAHVSASQVKSYRECPRRWAHQKLWHASTPETAAMRLGKDLHVQLETYFRGGRLPESDIAGAALIAAELEPASDILVELPLEDPAILASGVPWLGYIDLCVLPRDGEPPLVLDWKTTSDFRWAKTPSQLRTDPQSVAYARWAALRFYGARAFEYHRKARVNVAFVYTLTRGKAAARRVDVSFTVAELEEPWSAIERDVAEMVRLASIAPTPKELAQVPANWAACDQYGGCPHRSRCASDTTGQKSLTDSLVQLGSSKKGNDPMSKTLSSLFGSGATAAPAPGLALYVDCFPVTGVPDAQLLETIIAEHAAPLCAEAGVVDLRLIPYAAGKGALAASLRANPPTGAVICRSGELNDVAIEALRPLAAVVVQGGR